LNLDASHQSIGLLFGDSEVLIEEAIHEIKKHFTKNQYEVTSIEASQWIRNDFILGQSHLFDPQNLYLITRCESVKNWSLWLKEFASFTKINRDFRDKILLVFKSEKIPESFSKELKQISTPSISCFDPWPREYPTVINDLARRYELTFSQDALETLIEANGYDLIKHRNDLRKLSLIFSQQSPQIFPLKSSDISTHLGMLRTEEAIKLDHFLNEGEWEKAQSLVFNLINDGEKALSILGILTFHCRNKIKIEACKEQGLALDQMIHPTGLSHFVIKNSIANPKKVPLATYKRALFVCKNADFLLKSNKITPELLLFEIIDTISQKI